MRTGERERKGNEDLGGRRRWKRGEREKESEPEKKRREERDLGRRGR